MDNAEILQQSQAETQDANEFANQIAKLYSQYCLDVIVDLASWIATDFAARPHLYGSVEANIANVLSSFMSRLGNDPQWPNREQRIGLYTPLFGAQSIFGRSLQALFDAARRFAERHVDTGIHMLTQSFIDKAVVLRAGLVTNRGAAVNQAFVRTEAVFSQATKVLKNEHIAKVFALPPAEGTDWPVQLEPSGYGAALVEAVSIGMAQSQSSLKAIHPTAFLQLQLVAARGGDAVSFLLRPMNDPSQQIKACYSWLTSIDALKRDSGYLQSSKRVGL